jgi:hypothetical protein
MSVRQLDRASQAAAQVADFNKLHDRRAKFARPISEVPARLASMTDFWHLWHFMSD